MNEWMRREVHLIGFPDVCIISPFLYPSLVDYSNDRVNTAPKLFQLT